MRDTRRTRLILVLLLLTALTLITVDYRSGGHSPFRRVRSIATEVFGPVERALADVFRSVGHWFAEIGHLGSYQRQVNQLRRQNALLRGRLHLADDNARQLAALESLVHLAGAGQYRIVAAHVIAYGSPLNFEWTVQIDAGTLDGVRPDLTVLNGDGLVGRIIAASSTTSTVLLAVDPQSKVGVRLAPNGEVGFLQGNGLHDLQFTLLTPGGQLRPGEPLVTLGSYQQQRPYVAGVPVGTISAVLPSAGSVTRTALVRPYVDFSSLDIVGVVVHPPRTDPRFSLLPPKPTPAPVSPSPSRSPAPLGTLPPSTPAPTPTPSGTP